MTAPATATVSTSSAPASVTVTTTAPSALTEPCVVPFVHPENNEFGSTPLTPSVSVTARLSPGPTAPGEPPSVSTTDDTVGPDPSCGTSGVTRPGTAAFPATSRTVNVTAGRPSGAANENRAVPPLTPATPVGPPATDQSTSETPLVTSPSVMPVTVTVVAPAQTPSDSATEHPVTAVPGSGAVVSTTAGRVCVTDRLPARSTAATATVAYASTDVIVGVVATPAASGRTTPAPGSGSAAGIATVLVAAV